jgi:hypothetical protein
MNDTLVQRISITISGIFLFYFIYTLHEIREIEEKITENEKNTILYNELNNTLKLVDTELATVNQYQNQIDYEINREKDTSIVEQSLIKYQSKRNSFMILQFIYYFIIIVFFLVALVYWFFTIGINILNKRKSIHASYSQGPFFYDHAHFYPFLYSLIFLLCYLYFFV